MLVAICLRYDTEGQDPSIRSAVDSLRRGLYARGDTSVLVFTPSHVPPEAPVVVTFSANKPFHALIPRRTASGAPRRFLVLNWGAVDRQHYWQLGWDGLNGYADFNNCAVDEARFRIFGQYLRPWDDAAARSHEVLIIGQVPKDGSLRGTDIVGWCVRMATNVRLAGYAPVLRPHPLAPNSLPSLPGVPQYTGPIEALKPAAVLTYNSTTGGLACLHGYRTITMDRGSLAWEVTEHSLDCLGERTPKRPNRWQWVCRLGYTQWTKEELESGYPWSRLRDGAPRTA